MDRETSMLTAAGGAVCGAAAVLAVPASIPTATIHDVITNANGLIMTRVILIAPMLIFFGIYLSMQAKKIGKVGDKLQLVISWFAVYFIGMAGFIVTKLVTALL